MKVIRVTVQDEKGNQIFNDLVHVVEVSDAQKIVDNLEIIAQGVKDLMQRVAALEASNRRLHN